MKNLSSSLSVLFVTAVMATGAQAQQSAPGTTATRNDATISDTTRNDATTDNANRNSNTLNNVTPGNTDRRVDGTSADRSAMEASESGAYASNSLPSTASPMWLAAMVNGVGLVLVAGGLRFWRRQKAG